jgi:hypothetical protein
MYFLCFADILSLLVSACLSLSLCVWFVVIVN